MARSLIFASTGVAETRDPPSLAALTPAESGAGRGLPVSPGPADTLAGTLRRCRHQVQGTPEHPPSKAKGPRRGCSSSSSRIRRHPTAQAKPARSPWDSKGARGTPAHPGGTKCIPGWASDLPRHCLQAGWDGVPAEGGRANG